MSPGCIWHVRGYLSDLTERDAPNLYSLEAATSRLEDIAIAQQSQQLIGNVPGPSGQTSAPTAVAGGAGAGASSAAAPSAAAGGASGAGNSGASDNVRVKAFQELIDGPLKKYGELSSDIGGLVTEQVRVDNHGVSTMARHDILQY